MFEGMHTFDGVPKVCRPPPAKQGMAPEGMQAPRIPSGRAPEGMRAHPGRAQIVVPRLGESPNRTKKCGPQPNFVQKS